jgi:hypothetical protein
MRSAFGMILVLLLSAVAFSQAPDLSTDEGVLAAVQKRVDGERGLAGKPPSRLEKRDVCIKRIKDAAAVVIVGFFAYDRGCMSAGAFVDGTYIEKSDKTLSQKALAAMGWKRAEYGQRQQLALKWVVNGLFAFSDVVHQDDKESPIAGFHPPEVVTPKDGEITVTLWVRRPPGMRAEKPGYQSFRYEFSLDGELLRKGPDS